MVMSRSGNVFWRYADVAEDLVDEDAVGVVDATALRGLQTLKHVGREVPRDRGVFARILVHRALGLEGHGEPGVTAEVLGDEGLAVRRGERQAGRAGSAEAVETQGAMASCA